jgi:shikimate kinase
MNIFLIGFMGCGKTTLGSKLASKLNFTFIDLDKAIEETTEMTIAEYFEEYGELKFRELESDILQTAEFPENAVIATGGGAPCFYNNMDWMNENGITIYISMSPKALASRLKDGKDVRPLLKDLSEEEMVDFIADKLEARKPYYDKARYVMDGIDITPEKVIEALSPHLK